MSNDFNELYEYYSEFDTDDDPIDAIIDGVNHDNKAGLADFLGVSVYDVDDMIEYRHELEDRKFDDDDVLRMVSEKFDAELDADFLEIW